MPRLTKLSRSNSIQDVSIASLSVLDFLAPATSITRSSTKRNLHRANLERRHLFTDSGASFESTFYGALSEISLCRLHQRSCTVKYRSSPALDCRGADGLNVTDRKRLRRQNELLLSTDNSEQPPSDLIEVDRFRNNILTTSDLPRHRSSIRKQHRKFGATPVQTKAGITKDEVKRQNADTDAERGTLCLQGEYGSMERLEILANTHPRRFGKHGLPHSLSCKILSCRIHQGTASKAGLRDQSVRAIHGQASTTPEQPTTGDVRPRLVLSRWKRPDQDSYTSTTDFEAKQRRFAKGTKLPPNFFDDVSALHSVFSSDSPSGRQADDSKHNQTAKSIFANSDRAQLFESPTGDANLDTVPGIDEQLHLLKSVRELEARLEKAKSALERSLAEKRAAASKSERRATEQPNSGQTVVLSKEDYINLVDLYYHSQNSKNSPESTDESPTPIVLEDYSFELSSDFFPGKKAEEFPNEDEKYESPLKKVGEMIRRRQLREVAVMQVFVDLLVDDQSSNRALYEAYKELPEPGVAHIPKGIVRLFMQRMSTPWTLSQKSMLRYLALIDDMQLAKIPITVSEWSSAIYLAGRVSSIITDQEVNTSFNIWRTMEREAGVRGTHVTFNILFDIAVRSGKFALGESILQEMRSRNLRLNRLGRVSLMYYHGLRKDGDGVRKAYRDFVEAGEIVDTLVLNCVMASLLNAAEPQAAEQIYARMKNMHSRLRKGVNKDGKEAWYKRYPDPESDTIDQEMASNHLGRVLGGAPRLRRLLPDHHTHLQSLMPLQPDHITFRSMIAYHATVSGNLDRVTILLKEMTEVFELPLQTLTFQLLFKGFAIHGPLGGPQSAWSSQRLAMCWKACIAAIKESENVKPLRTAPWVRPESYHDSDVGEDKPESPSETAEPTLPSITHINAIPQHADLPDFSPPLSRPSPRRLSEWSEFVLDLAAFPRERLKRLERFHATMFDAEDMPKPHENPGVHTFKDPYFQSSAYTAPEPSLDKEEGEYELPNPSDPKLLHTSGGGETLEGSPHQVAATRAMVCWLLRAYARVTKSRNMVEEVWGQVRKLYRPQGDDDRNSVVRVLRRCLRDCDQEGIS